MDTKNTGPIAEGSTLGSAGQWAMGRQCALSLVPPPVFPFSSSRITALYSASQFPTSISTKDQQRPQKGSQMLVGSLFFCNPRLLPIFETFDPLRSTLFPSAASSAHRKLSWFNRRAVSFQERLFFATLPPSAPSRPRRGAEATSSVFS